MPLPLFLLLLGYNPPFCLGMAKDFEKKRGHLRLRKQSEENQPRSPGIRNKNPQYQHKTYPIVRSPCPCRYSCSCLDIILLFASEWRRILKKKEAIYACVSKEKKISPDLARSAIKTRNINTKRTL